MQPRSILLFVLVAAVTCAAQNGYLPGRTIRKAMKLIAFIIFATAIATAQGAVLGATQVLGEGGQLVAAPDAGECDLMV